MSPFGTLHRLVALLLIVSACSRGTPAAAPDDASSRTADAVSAGRVRRVTVDEPEPEALAEVVDVVHPEPTPPPTGSWKTQRSAVVRNEPSSESAALGLLAGGARLTRAEPLVTDECPRGWLAVEPRGFVCTEVELDRRDPTDTVLPHVPKGMRIPGAYGRVNPDSAVIYASLSDALSDLGGRHPAASLTVRRLRTVRGGGRRFWKTRHGLIEAKHIRRFRGSGFQGVELTGPEALTLPLAWTVGHYDRKTIAVRSRPSGRSRVVARLPKRQPHSLLERSEDDAWIRVEEGWIARSDVRVAETTERPEAADGSERWLDIDLSQQTLVAYEGDTPIYATLISSGKANHTTPTGVFRIDRKVAERTMNSMADSDDLYSVDKVPWTAYFAKGYALHAAFWHSGFGTRRSHGCVNLAPLDARRLYDWTAPLVAPGWSEIFGHEEQPGSVIRIRSRRDPQPRLRGYALKLAQNASSSST